MELTKSDFIVLLEQISKVSIKRIFQEYPTYNAQYLASPSDLSLPRERRPLFWGSYDWHSCAHTHWAICAAYPYVSNETQQKIIECIDNSLNIDDINKETIVWDKMSPTDFYERPYGITWLLKLCSEIHKNSLDNIIAIIKIFSKTIYR